MLKLLKKFIKKRKSTCAAVIVAAGSSSRMKGTDKILHPIAGEPLIAHTIRVFQQCSCIQQIIIVTRAELIAQMQMLCDEQGFDKVTQITQGGASRAESVMKGLDCVCENISYVAVHDGARPFVTDTIVKATFEKAVDYHAAAPALPVKDTIKMAYGNLVTHTPDRACLYAVQTPQIFDFDLLRGALSKVLKDGIAVTDDCSVVESIGMSVYLTQGSDENIKITTPTDLILAQAIWEGRQDQ